MGIFNRVSRKSIKSQHVSSNDVSQTEKRTSSKRSSSKRSSTKRPKSLSRQELARFPDKQTGVNVVKALEVLGDDELTSTAQRTLPESHLPLHPKAVERTGEPELQGSKVASILGSSKRRSRSRTKHRSISDAEARKLANESLVREREEEAASMLKKVLSQKGVEHEDVHVVVGDENRDQLLKAAKLLGDKQLSEEVLQSVSDKGKVNKKVIQIVGADKHLVPHKVAQRHGSFSGDIAAMKRADAELAKRQSSKRPGVTAITEAGKRMGETSTMLLNKGHALVDKSNILPVNALRKKFLGHGGTDQPGGRSKVVQDSSSSPKRAGKVDLPSREKPNAQAAKMVALQNLENELLFAASNGDLYRIDTLAKLVDVNCVDDFCMTPLHMAAFSGRADACLHLLQLGADVDAVDEWGRTCVHQAAAEGHHATTIALIAYGAGHLVNAQDSEGATALHLATENGHRDTVLGLLDANADVNVYDWWSKTPLLMAAENGLAKVFKVLVNAGSDLGAVDDWGRTALHLAVESNSLSTVKAVLKAESGASKGADLINMMDKSSFTAYSLAVESGFDGAAELMAGHVEVEAKVGAQGGGDGSSDTHLKNTKKVRANMDRNRKKMKKQRQATLERIMNARNLTNGDPKEHWAEDKKLIDDNFDALKAVLKQEKWMALLLRTEVLDYYLAHPGSQNRRLKD